MSIHLKAPCQENQAGKIHHYSPLRHQRRFIFWVRLTDGGFKEFVFLCLLPHRTIKQSRSKIFLFLTHTPIQIPSEDRCNKIKIIQRDKNGENRHKKKTKRQKPKPQTKSQRQLQIRRGSTNLFFSPMPPLRDSTIAVGLMSFWTKRVVLNFGRKLNILALHGKVSSKQPTNQPNKTLLFCSFSFAPRC